MPRSTRLSSENYNYMRIDHRDSPGFSIEQQAHAGFLGLSVGKGEICEVATKKCWHCEKQLIMNPERKRRREICPHCDEYICDNCWVNFRLTGKCDNWIRREEEFYRQRSFQQLIAKGL